MTAVPVPRNVTVQEDDSPSKLFPMKSIKKNLEKEFATPQVKQHLSRLSNQSYICGSEYMKVYVRVRPFLQTEVTTKEDQGCLEISKDGHMLTLHPPRDSNRYKSISRGVGENLHQYSFTKVFKPEIGQKDFFDATALKIVEDFIKGQNSLIFTYGVTSSGKTYTIQGSPGNEGIMPRSVDVIFNSVGDQIVKGSNLKLSMASSVTVVSDEEKECLLKEKQDVLAIADKIGDQLESSIPKDSLDTFSESSGSCSMMRDSSSANNTVNECQTNSTRLSFMEFSHNVADDSFVDVSAQGSLKYVMFVSFIEIYKEYIYDLFQPLPKGKDKKRSALKLAEDRALPFVKNLREIQVHSREEIFKLLTIGQNNLHIAETKLNHNSSRSHCIFTIKLVSTTETDKPTKTRVSQLSFCDLAGSERWGKTNSFGERLKEAGKINSSLLTLGKCIETLRFNQQHQTNQRVVPYRESRLTRLFQSILKGHGKACMIVNVNQCASMFDETAHVLKFSAIASQVKVIDKPLIRKSSRASSRKTASISTSEEESLSAPKQRFTIGWEPTHTPIKEEDNDSEEDEESSSEEDSEEVSDDEEHDEAYWKDREKKMIHLITLLQDALAKEKKNVWITERNTRLECADEWQKVLEENEETWEERRVRDLKNMEEFGEKKYMSTVTNANSIIKGLHEDKVSLQQQVDELDKECDELDQNFEAAKKAHETEVKALNDKLAAKEMELESAKASIAMKDKTIEELRGSQPKSEKARLFEENEVLRRENQDGREIIQEQLEQVRELGEALEAKVEELDRLKDVAVKNEDLTAAFEEAVACAEMKSTEVEQLKAEVEKLIEEKQQFITQMDEVNDRFTSKQEKEREQLNKTHQENILELKEEHEKKLKEKAKQHKKELLNLDCKIRSANDEAAEARKELSVANKLERQLMAEIDRLQSQAKQLESDKTLRLSQDKKRSSKAIELSQDLSILTMERDDLLKTVEKLTNDLSKVTKAKQELEKENRQPCLSVAQASELESLKTTYEETRNSMVAQQKTIETYEAAKAEKEKELSELKKEIECLQEEKEELSKTLSDKLRIIAEERDNLSQTLEKQDTNISKLSQEKRDLEDAKTKAIEIHRADIAEKEQCLKKISKELKNMQIEKEALEGTVSRLQTEKSSAEASGVTRVKDVVRECEEMKTEFQQIVETLKREKTEAESKVTALSKEIRDLKKENKKISDELEQVLAGRNTAEALRSDLAEALKVNETKVKELEEESSRQQSDAQKEKQRAAEKEREIKILHKQVESISEAKEKELKKFREARDRISKQLETQINNYKSRNNALKEQLEARIQSDVQLRSEISRLNAELQMKQKYNPVVVLPKPIKQETLELPTTSLDSLPERAQSTSGSSIDSDATPTNSPAEEVVTMLDISTGMQKSPVLSHDEKDRPEENNENEEPSAQLLEQSTRGRRATRTSTRQPVVKKTSSRRKRGAPRPATPVAEEILATNDDATEKASKPTRTRKTRQASTSSLSVKNEPQTITEADVTCSSTTPQVLDDSDLMRATGHSQEFPKSQMEIDVTPQLKKTRGRKRTNKQKDAASNQNQDASDASNDNASKRKPRKKEKIEDDDFVDDASLKTKPSNVARMGDILKNSPVGQAFKRFEAAISPSRSPSSVSTSASNAFVSNDPCRRTTRRLRKLHTDDISLPLESTSNQADIIGAVGRGVGVLTQTQNIGVSGVTRKLRRRK